MPAVRSPVRSQKVSSSFLLIFLSSEFDIIAKPRSINITGLYFPQAAKRFMKVDIATVIPAFETVNSPRFPAVEHILGTTAATHDCSVTVLDEQQHRRKFIIFFKYDRQNNINGALKEMYGLNWKGEIVVMKQGDRCFVTSIAKKHDQTLATEAVIR